MTEDQLKRRAESEKKRMEAKERTENNASEEKMVKSTSKNRPLVNPDFPLRKMDPLTASLINEFCGQLEKERQMTEDAMRLVELSQTIINEQRALIENYKQLLNIRGGN